MIVVCGAKGLPGALNGGIKEILNLKNLALCLLKVNVSLTWNELWGKIIFLHLDDKEEFINFV
jgi:hypothetical protein